MLALLMADAVLAIVLVVAAAPAMRVVVDDGEADEKNAVDSRRRDGPVPLWTRPTLSGPGSLLVGESAALTAIVRDPEGAPLAGVTVTLSVKEGEGTFNGGTCNGTFLCTGRTGDDGRFHVVYTAPMELPMDPYDVEVTLRVPTPDPLFPMYVARHSIPVYGASLPVLHIFLSFPAGDLVSAGGEIPIDIEVWDSTGSPVPDATVAVWSSDPVRLRPSLESGTAREMTTVWLEAGETTTSAGVVVTVFATRAGTISDGAAATITVLAGTARPPCPDGSITGDADGCPRSPSLLDGVGGIAVVAVALAAAAAASIVAFRRRRRAR